MPINPNSNNINPNTGLPYTKEESLIMTRFNSMNTGQSALSPLDTRFQTTGQKEYYQSPEELDSYLTRGVSIQAGGANEEVRAENQSGLEQLGYGLAKMGGLATTTFLDGTLGTITGLGNILTGGSFIDNPFSNAMLDANDKMEELFPNYYTSEAIDNPFKGIVPFTQGSANFWGDKILKNFGFALGAYGAGLVTSGLGNMALEKVMANRTAKAITQVLQAEGRSGKEIEQMLQAVQSGDKAAIDYFKNSKTILDAINADAKAINYGNVANQWVASMAGAAGESRIEALGNSRQFRENQLAELQARYGDNIPEQELRDLDNRVNNYMNTTFGINMAILTLSDYTQFSDAFRSRMAKQRALLGEITGGLETGYQASKMTNWEKAFRLAKNPLVEGTQEQLQYATQKGTDDYFTRRYDENGKEIVNSFIDSYVKGLGEAYGSAEGWEQFATGAIIGALGMPNIPKITGQKGLIQGGIYGELQDIQRQEATTNKAVEDINRATEYFKNNEGAKEQYENLVRIASLNEEQKKAALAGDTFEVKNLEEDKFLSNVQAFYNAGKIEDLEDFYKGLASKKGSDIRESTKITKDAQGNLLAEPVDQFKGLTDKEIEQYFQQKSQNALSRINTIKKLKSDIDERFATEPDVYKEQLLHYAYTIQDVDKRFGELKNKVESKMASTIKPQFEKTDKTVSDRDFETPMFDSSLIFEDAIALEDYINKKGGLENYKKAIKEYSKKHPQDLSFTEDAEDLVRLAERKKAFVDKYVQGLTKKGKNEVIKKAFDDLREKIGPELQKQANKQDFNTQVQAKGYSLDKIDNKSGIFVRYKDGTYLLKRDENGNIILRNLDSNKTISIGTANDFDNFLANNKLQVLSREEYKDLRKKQEVSKYRQAEVKAIEALLKDTTERGKKKKEQLVKAEKELQEKLQELKELQTEINKGYISPEFRQELQTLVNELQESINDLKAKVEELQKERETLVEFYRLYKEQLDRLKEIEDSFTDFNQLYNEERITRNIVKDSLYSELPFTIEEIDNLIKSLEKVVADNLEKIDTYQEYLDVIKLFLKRDVELRDFLSSMDFNDAFNQKYPKEVRQRITPRFIKEYFDEKKLDPTITNEQLNKLNELLDLVEANPEYINEMNSLLDQKAKLKELKDNIKFNSENIEFTEKQLEFLRSSLTDATAKLEKLIDQRDKLKYLESNTLAAIYNIKEKARDFYNKSTYLTQIEKADPQAKEPEKTNKENWVAENAKKGDWNTTTGQVIIPKYDAKTDTYEDEIGPDGLPLFTNKQAQILWAKYLDDNSNELKSGKYRIKFHLHNPNGKSSIDVQISANIDKTAISEDNDLYAIIADENGNPIDIDGKFIFTGIHKTETLFPQDDVVRLIRLEKLVGNKNAGLGNYLQNEKGNPFITINGVGKSARDWEKEDNWEEIKDKEIQRIIKGEKEAFDNFRNKVKTQLKEGKNVFSKITDVSDGIPYLGDKLNSVKSLLTGDFELEYDTKTGDFLAITEDGKKIPIQGDLLSDSEAKTVIALLQYAFPKDSETFVGTIKLPKDQTYQFKDFLEIFPKGAGSPNVLNALIYYGRNKEGAKKYNIWGTKQLQFVDENNNLQTITREDLHDSTSEGFIKLTEFLKTKRLNFNRGFIKEGRYYHPILKDSKLDWRIYSNYKDYVKEKGKTYLVSKGKDYPLFTNRYVTYSTEIDNSTKPPEPPKTMGGLGKMLSAADMAGEFDIDDEFVNDMSEFQEDLSEEQDSGLSADIFGLPEEKKEEPKKEEIQEKPKAVFNIQRKQPKGKERVVKITDSDALNRLKELIKEGIIDKNCS